MSYPKRQRLSVTTDASGNATATFAQTVQGKIKQIVYTKDGTNAYSNGSTITFSNTETGETIWAETGVNASAVRAPRIATHSNAGVAALYAAAGQAVNDDFYCAGDHVQVVISGGGNTKVGQFDLIYE